MDQNPDGSNVADVNEDLLDEESDCDNADGAMGHLPHINPADLMITGWGNAFLLFLNKFDSS